MILKYYPQFDFNLFIINLTLDIILEVLFLGIACYILYRLYIKKEIKSRETERGNINNLITWALFFLLMGIGHLLKIIVSLHSINGTILESLESLLEKIDLIIIFSAFLIKIIYLEHVIVKMNLTKRYFFSIFFIIVIILMIFIDYDAITETGLIQVVFLSLFVIGYSILPFLYLYLAIKTSGINRINAFKVSIGTLLFGLFSLLQVDNLIGYYGESNFLNIWIETLYITGPLGVIIGSLLIFDSFRKRE